MKVSHSLLIGQLNQENSSLALSRVSPLGELASSQEGDIKAAITNNLDQSESS